MKGKIQTMRIEETGFKTNRIHSPCYNIKPDSAEICIRLLTPQNESGFLLDLRILSC